MVSDTIKKQEVMAENPLMMKPATIEQDESLEAAVLRNLQSYFKTLNGMRPQHELYPMVIQAVEKPLLEAFLLDPDACAACTYMWASACDMKKHFGDKIDVVEYRYNNIPDISRTRKMAVAQLPSLYLNGKMIYSSIIPNPEDLIKQIEEVL